MKKIFNLLVILFIGVLIISQIKLVKQNNALQEEKLINAYIECLQENFTQRDYCSKQVSDVSYKVLDKKLEKYGYTYKQKGYDLYLVRVEK